MIRLLIRKSTRKQLQRSAASGTLYLANEQPYAGWSGLRLCLMLLSLIVAQLVSHNFTTSILLR